ncbi:DUF1643 domain-containing protein [Croceicoccus mobilis]|uniref:DUF1643 domain-containing protein n=1 Tax=Croceicoccus mobilis TaxID=1703339 RepID=A0A916YYK6_9SPHN|nr:DUF1643 domain-containing protein [Croceicoccus mobilis]GGD67506.1 hypothetical protein GCM10010990_16230 [Croceicoccus mobilis]
MNAALAIERIARWATAAKLDFRHDRAGGHGAVFSRCGRYRYLLWRDAGPGCELLGIAMLNPSKADHLHNDPTIARCHSRALEEGASLLVWNLFALRETDPLKLKKRRGPVGGRNDEATRLALEIAPRTIAAWGVHGAHRGRADQVARLAQESGYALMCLGVTKEGHPRHPLYLKKGTPMQGWPLQPISEPPSDTSTVPVALAAMSESR